MLTTAGRTRKQSMTSRLARLAAGAAVSVAFMTVAAPAMAMQPPEPSGGSIEYSAGPPPPSAADGTVDLSSVALGALGSIAVSGVGLGIAFGVQHRRDRSLEHPA